MSGEHILIIAAILIIFGPRRLPQLGQGLGKAIRNFKDGLAGIKEAEYKKLDEKLDESKDDAKKDGKA